MMRGNKDIARQSRSACGISITKTIDKISNGVNPAHHCLFKTRVVSSSGSTPLTIPSAKSRDDSACPACQSPHRVLPPARFYSLTIPHCYTREKAHGGQVLPRLPKPSHGFISRKALKRKTFFISTPTKGIWRAPLESQQ